MELLIHSQLLGSGSLLAVGVTGAMNVWTYFGWTGNLYPFCWNSKFLKANWQRDAMAWQLVFKAWFREAVEVRQTSIRDYYILSRIKAPLLNLCGKSTFSKEDEIWSTLKEIGDVMRIITLQGQCQPESDPCPPERMRRMSEESEFDDDDDDDGHDGKGQKFGGFTSTVCVNFSQDDLRLATIPGQEGVCIQKYVFTKKDGYVSK